MPELLSAEGATEIAVNFLRKNNYPFPQPLKATLEDGVWTLEIDVGFGTRRIAKVRVDRNTHSIVDYEVP